MAVQVRTGQFHTVATSPVRTWNINNGVMGADRFGVPACCAGGTADGDPRERRCTMNPQMAFALSALILVITPLVFLIGLIALKVLLILALSRDNEERREALMALLTGTLKRR